MWYGVCVVWCCEVRKCEKTQEIKEKRSKHGLRFRHDIAIHAPNNGPKTVIYPNTLFFTLSLGFIDVFGRRSYSKRPKIRFSAPGPIPKVLIMRWKMSQPAKHPVIARKSVRSHAGHVLIATMIRFTVRTSPNIFNAQLKLFLERGIFAHIFLILHVGLVFCFFLKQIITLSQYFQKLLSLRT